MSMSEAGDIIDEATREVPEEIMDSEQVENAFQHLFNVLSTVTDWIDPDSEVFEEHLDSAKRDGAVAVVERYQSMLADALHRQKMFGEVFDLQGFIDQLSRIPIEEVL